MSIEEKLDQQLTQLLGLCSNVKPHLQQNLKYLKKKEIQDTIGVAIRNLESILEDFEKSTTPSSKKNNPKEELNPLPDNRHEITVNSNSPFSHTKIGFSSMADSLEYMLKESPAILYTSQPEFPYAIDFLSENVLEIMGYTPTQLINNTNYWTEKLHPEDLQRVNTTLEHLTKKGGGKVEYRFKFADGKYRWMLDHFKVSYDNEGKVKTLVGCLIDITDKKEKEEMLSVLFKESQSLNEELKASDEELRQSLDKTVELNDKLIESEQLNKWIISSVNQGIMVFNQEGSFVGWNPFLENFTGYPSNKVIGYFPRDLFPNAVKYGLITELQNTLATGSKFTSEIYLPDRGANGVWLSVSITPLINNYNTIVGAIGTVNDITIRKKTEKALQEQKDLLQSFFDSAPFIMSVIELSGDDFIYKLANRYLADFMGIKLEVLQGKSGKELGIPQHIIDESILLIKQSIDLNSIRQIEYEFPRFDGAKRILFCTYTPINSNSISLVSQDITEQKQIKKEKSELLEKTRQLYKELEINHEKLITAKRIAGIEIWEFDLLKNEGKISKDDQTAGGIEPNINSITIEEFIEMLAPEHVKIFKDAWFKASIYGESFDIVIKIKTRNNRYRWKRSFGKPVFDTSGKVVKIIGLTYDLTKQKEAEGKIGSLFHQSQYLNLKLLASEEDLKQALQNTLELNERIKESEQRWKFALEGNGEGVWDWNMETNTVFFSPKCKELLGYREDEIVNTIADWESKIHEDDKEKVQETLRDYLSQKTDEFIVEYRCTKNTKDYFWVLARGKVVETKANGEHLRIIGTMADISRRKESELRITDFSNYLDKIINTIIAPIFVKDDKHQWVLVNDAFCEYLNLTREEVLGKTDYDYFPKERAEEMWYNEELIFKTGKDIIKEEYLPNFDGKNRVVNIKKSLYVDNSNKPFIVGIFVDITEQKEWERKLEEQNENLKKINAELDSFVYRTSHDLRSPLTSVLGLINISKIEPEDEVRRSYLDLMEKSVIKLDNFIQDILNYSRNTRVEIDPQEIDIQQLFHEILAGLKFMEEYESIDKIIEIEQSVPFYSDIFRLKIIFNNLISNAIKYKSPFVKQSFIKIKAFIYEKSAVFEFSDNGNGIAKENREKIFDMFYRASTHSIGSGLGLYIVKETVLTLKGKIDVESELGKGTVFRIDLPNNRT